jgi:hypothetical protein
MLQIENSINEAARYYHTSKNKNVIIIYDRGCMDPIACTQLSFFFINLKISI